MLNEITSQSPYVGGIGETACTRMALIAQIASLLEARWKDCCRRYYFTVDDSRSLRHNEGDDGVISSVPRRRHVNPTSNPIRSAAAAAAAGVDNENYGRPTMGSMRCDHPGATWMKNIRGDLSSLDLGIHERLEICSAKSASLQTDVFAQCYVLVAARRGIPYSYYQA